MLSSDSRLLESGFDVLNKVYFNSLLPKAIITIQSSPKSYGYITVNEVWQDFENKRHEINISADDCSVSGIRGAKKVLGITRKKTIQYVGRNEQKHEGFITEIESLPDDSELYYVDESGFDEYYSREYVYAPRGEKAIGTISGRHFARTSIVAAQNGHEIIAPFAFSGSMNGDLFEGWLDPILVPKFNNLDKCVLIVDNVLV